MSEHEQVGVKAIEASGRCDGCREVRYFTIPGLDKLGWWYLARDIVTQYRKACSSVAGFDGDVGVFRERFDRRSLSTACGSRSPANNRQVSESSLRFTASESMTDDGSEWLSSGTVNTWCEMGASSEIIRIG